MKLTSLTLLVILLVGTAGAGCLGKDAEDAPETVDLAANDAAADADDNETLDTGGNATDPTNTTVPDGNATAGDDNNTAGNETAPTPPPAAPQPAKPEDYVATHGGWVDPAPTEEGFVATHAFPVEAGVRVVMLRVDFSTEDPSGQAGGATSPVHWEVTVRAPSGDTVDNATNLGVGAATDPTISIGNGENITFTLENLTEWGDYELEIKARGGSDGATWGHRYDASIYVDY